jgi:hypothetical protein
MPNKTGSIVPVSAWGMTTPNPAHIGLTKKFTRKPRTHTQAIAGLQDD